MMPSNLYVCMIYIYIETRMTTSTKQDPEQNKIQTHESLKRTLLMYKTQHANLF